MEFSIFCFIVNLEIFLNEWNTADKKKVLIDEMTNKGIIFENLNENI